ncbi:hypothetical protein GBA65_20680 [Rubrobacter marinus]|uniref:Uncharacterized protein n=1 Tax=Rubrobacter marinus TaxID=2653852 RepID=A0A6G8Q2I4_9ACTN|nr:hypothetical protein [Rubrobacter marinus]QIN80527.1 hypothetical protein GBA65_20680 [Rubrobacter marinus]
MRAIAGFTVRSRQSVEAWKMPSTAFSKIPRYFSSARRSASSVSLRPVTSSMTEIKYSGSPEGPRRSETVRLTQAAEPSPRR